MRTCASTCAWRLAISAGSNAISGRCAGSFQSRRRTPASARCRRGGARLRRMRRIAVLIVSSFAWLAGPAASADLISFWDSPRHGANCFNERPPDEAYFRALRGYGATWVRVAFSKWRSPTGKRDFLFGNLDDYRALVPEDLAILREVLDHAHAA